jgi:protein-arginine deiminase
VVLFNCDDDDVDTTIDAENESVDGAADGPDLARVDVLARSNVPGWYAVLSISDATHLRVFDGAGPGATAVLGPAAGDRYRLPNPGGRETYWIEALTFPDDGFSPALFDITITVFDRNDAVICSDRARFRVAPWLMLWNGRPTRTLYVVEVPNTEMWPGTPHSQGTEDVIGTLRGVLPPGMLEVVDGPSYDNDRWVQDWMEIGEHHAPYHAFDVVMDSNGRAPPHVTSGLTYARGELLGPDYGYDTRNTATSTLDSFGNLEVSPPVRARGKDYLFGRIYFGDPHPDGPFDPRFRRFLDRHQIVQHPFAIDTAWLFVGHADEVVSFVPADDLRGFRMLIASPRRAHRILRRLAIRHPDWEMLVDRFDPVVGLTRRIDDYLASPLVAYNDGLQARIDGVRATMVRELDLDRREIVEIPVLFQEQRGAAVALTGNMVNLQCVADAGPLLLVPQPFGPEDPVTGADRFADYTRRVMRRIGNRCVFVDTWYSYHLLEGEIHCGTNARRRQLRPRRWWWMDEAP